MVKKKVLSSIEEAEKYLGGMYCEDSNGQEHLVTEVSSQGEAWLCLTTDGKSILSRSIWIYIDDESTEYIWCLHCEKVHHYTLWEKEGQEDGECPACGAGEFTDGWDWGRVRKVNRKYPKKPKDGALFPLYGLESLNRTPEPTPSIQPPKEPIRPDVVPLDHFTGYELAALMGISISTLSQYVLKYQLPHTSTPRTPSSKKYVRHYSPEQADYVKEWYRKNQGNISANRKKP